MTLTVNYTIVLEEVLYQPAFKRAILIRRDSALRLSVRHVARTDRRKAH